MRLSSFTVTMHSKIEPKLDGYMLFVWVIRVFHGKTPLINCYEDIGIRSYGPVDNEHGLNCYRGLLEKDALAFYTKDENVPPLIRSLASVKPRITYRLERV